MWVNIEGYRFKYRINDDGIVQKLLDDGTWYTLKPYTSGRARACVKMRTVENKKVDVPVKNLMADAFLGGKPPGMALVNKNGCKFDCGLQNLQMMPIGECGLLSCRSRRRPVMKLSREGEVLEIYDSVAEAAKKNFISRTSVWIRCSNQVQDPYRLDGCNYQFEDKKPTKRKKEQST